MASSLEQELSALENQLAVASKAVAKVANILDGARHVGLVED
jgi:hypothetical protein